MSEKKKLEKKAVVFIEGEDYYFDEGLMVLTGKFLLNRGYCCGNKCRHCPYPNTENTDLQKESV